jgi:hypothetical protein
VLLRGNEVGTMWKQVLATLLCVFGLAAPAGAAPDAESGAKSQVVQGQGDDVFMAGGTLNVYQPVMGDLIVVGGTIDVDAPVAGDALALGGNVRLGEGIGQSIYSAAGQLTVGGRVGRNVRVMGGQVKLGPKSEIVGNVSAAGGRLQLHGTVHGNVQMTGGRVLINGPVGGDVFAGGGRVALGPNAHIAGKLRYRSSEDLEQDAAARVDGGTERIAVPPRTGKDRRGAEDLRQARHAGTAIAGGVWLLGLIALAAVLLTALPNFSTAVARRLFERPGLSLLLGFIVLVCVPAAVLMLFITVIGLPLGLFALALYPALLLIAYVGAGIAIGDWMLQRWRPAAAAKPLLRVVATAGALIALFLLGWIPVLGHLLGFLALLGGLGALVLQAKLTRLSTHPAPGAPQPS